MNFNTAKIVRSLLPLILISLGGCPGGGGGAAAPSYTIGGAVSGLKSSVVLRNNGGDDLTVTANTTFTFATSISDGSPYAVTVLTQPNGQICTVSAGSGTVSGGNVSSVAVKCLSKMGGSMQGAALNLSKVVSTYAGLPFSADGTGAAARFSFPQASVSDGSNLYVADTYNNTIRKIVIATGVVTTLAGQVGLAGAADGAGATATFNAPGGITTDGSNLYVADSYNNKIRQIVIATGMVSSVTGAANTAGAWGAADGAGTTATLSRPFSITTDGTNLYVADTYNNKIRQIVISTGVVSSVTGTANTASATGAADGAGATATFNYPSGITTNGTNLYVADSNNHKIRQIVITTGAVSSVTGTTNTASVLGAADGTGATATFKSPEGITTDGTNLYVADTYNHKIRQIVIASHAVSSLAGAPPGSDGTGTTAIFGSTGGIATDGNNLYVADTGNNTIRKILIATGMVTTIAGQVGVSGSADGIGTAASFNYPEGITTDGTKLYVADSGNNKIRQIVIATGVVSSVTGTTSTASAFGAMDGDGATATFDYPKGITTDGINLYVADYSNSKIRKIVIATGMVSSVTGAANTSSTQGAADGAGATATFDTPEGITTDGVNLYVADTYNNKIRQIVISTSVVSSVTGAAGVTGMAGAAEGTGVMAKFDRPSGITTDGTNLYVTDTFNNKIRQIVIASGVVSSVTGTAGTLSTAGVADGAGATATLNRPNGITTDGISLYVADTNNATIRKIQ